MLPGPPSSSNIQACSVPGVAVDEERPMSGRTFTGIAGSDQWAECMEENVRAAAVGPRAFHIGTSAAAGAAEVAADAASCLRCCGCGPRLSGRAWLWGPG